MAPDPKVRTDESPASAAEPRAQAPRKRKRRSFKREEILAVACQLFHERGYPEVGINDIGAAVGITGPAVYRHYESKQELLAAVIWYAVRQMMAEASRTATTRTPMERLQKLISQLIDNSSRNRELMLVYMRERRHLSERHQDQLRAAHMQYIADWVAALRAVRPELSEAEARVHVESVIWMGNSLAFYQPEGDMEELKARLRAMAIAACLAQAPSDVAEADRAPASAPVAGLPQDEEASEVGDGQGDGLRPQPSAAISQ